MFLVVSPINTQWRNITGKTAGRYEGTADVYKKDLTALLDRAKQKLPGLKLIIGEPFAVTGIKAVDEKWYPAFDEYRKATYEIADSFDAVFIPYQYCTFVGVHPSVAGAKLMAEAWLKAVKG